MAHILCYASQTMGLPSVGVNFSGFSEAADINMGGSADDGFRLIDQVNHANNAVETGMNNQAAALAPLHGPPVPAPDDISNVPSESLAGGIAAAGAPVAVVAFAGYAGHRAIPNDGPAGPIAVPAIVDPDHDNNYVLLGFIALQPIDFHAGQGRQKLEASLFGGNFIPFRHTEDMAIQDGALNANVQQSFAMATQQTEWHIIKVQITTVAMAILQEVGVIQLIRQRGEGGADKGYSYHGSLGLSQTQTHSFLRVTTKVLLVPELGYEQWARKHLHLSLCTSFRAACSKKSSPNCFGTQTGPLWCRNYQDESMAICSACSHSELQVEKMRCSLYSSW